MDSVSRDIVRRLRKQHSRFCSYCTQYAIRRNEPTSRMNRKRRTVLWLYLEDYEYLQTIAEHDSDSKSSSMTRLVRILRRAHIKTFTNLEEFIDQLLKARSQH